MDDSVKILSVVIPVYNMAHKLQRLSLVIERCTALPISVIIVNDESNDDTYQELQQIVKSYNYNVDVKLLKGKFGNPGDSRNYGITKANNEWIVFWDSDDFSFPERFIEAINIADSATQVIIGQYETIDFETGLVRSISSHSTLSDIALNPGVWRMIFRREIINTSNFSRFSIGEDQNFLTAINLHARNIQFIDKTLYQYYRGQPYQLTKRFKKYDDLLSVALTTVEKVEKYPNNFDRLLLAAQILTYLKHFFQQEQRISYLKKFVEFMQVISSKEKFVLLKNIIYIVLKKGAFRVLL